ncbi:ubiquitin carboxyl-terminal hydrolase isozyme L3 [Gilbertella persicaria]|uniref:ubiquitin carboxyl-terminal hydrolase isozyme L3 n=1 Tax=Gilbertella persicaria TaxID=101096 RepID=UPI0022203987|nr:ubiquitin carboxyl-terminal hydrolase isozyme L3 [Gilbertella persicaria]KAI8070568.1 ubiquitin carboxyl-terminal hydrolase isozyme L3 [Gilbertella persicaria]
MSTFEEPRLKWLPLEANPEVWNHMIHANGIDSTWNFVDVLGLDEEGMASIPRPCVAMIFLFPITPAYEAFRKKEETHIKVHEQNISPNLIYYKQTISNACGMMALLHSITNNEHIITGPGLFEQILEDTRTMSPDERAEYLENSKELAVLHASSAHQGQTQAPDLNQEQRLHFICFVNVDQHLYELDGRHSFPINHGKCQELVQGSMKIIQSFIDRNPEEKEFSAIALCHA